MVDQPNKDTIKIVIIGDVLVGKTCMLMRFTILSLEKYFQRMLYTLIKFYKSYTQDKFPYDYLPTVFDNYSVDSKYENKCIVLSLWSFLIIFTIN